MHKLVLQVCSSQHARCASVTSGAVCRIHRRPRSLLSRARSWVHIVAIAVLCLCAFGALYFEARVDLSQVSASARCNAGSVGPETSCARRPARLRLR